MAGRSSHCSASSCDPSTAVALARISANFQVLPLCSGLSGFSEAALCRWRVRRLMPTAFSREAGQRHPWQARQKHFMNIELAFQRTPETPLAAEQFHDAWLEFARSGSGCLVSRQAAYVFSPTVVALYMTGGGVPRTHWQ